VINYASNSMMYREARLYRTQGYHLKATCEAQRFCEKSAAPPKCRPRRRRRGWRRFCLRLTSYAYVNDGYYRALRRPLYVTTCICHKIRMSKPPTKRGTIKNLPVALCGVVTGPLGGLRRDTTLLSRLTRRTRSLLESSTKTVRDGQACSSTSTQQGSSGMDRQWCHSIFRHVRVPNPSSPSVFVGGGVGRPETRLVYTVPTQIMDRNKLGV